MCAEDLAALKRLAGRATDCGREIRSPQSDSWQARRRRDEKRGNTTGDSSAVRSCMNRLNLQTFCCRVLSGRVQRIISVQRPFSIFVKDFLRRCFIIVPNLFKHGASEVLFLQTNRFFQEQAPHLLKRLADIARLVSYTKNALID